MACGCKGNAPGTVDYVVLFKGGEQSVTVGSLSEVRAKLAASSRGGTYRVVPKSK